MMKHLLTAAALGLQATLAANSEEPLPAPSHAAVYQTGNRVPNSELPGGPPTDAVFSGFGVPAISENGSFAFLASWKSESARGAGIWSNGMLVVTTGDPVLGIPG